MSNHKREADRCMHAHTDTGGDKLIDRGKGRKEKHTLTDRCRETHAHVEEIQIMYIVTQSDNVPLI
jgi:hypothetical protein